MLPLLLLLLIKLYDKDARINCIFIIERKGKKKKLIHRIRYLPYFIAFLFQFLIFYIMCLFVGGVDSDTKRGANERDIFGDIHVVLHKLFEIRRGINVGQSLAEGLLDHCHGHISRHLSDCTDIY